MTLYRPAYYAKDGWTTLPLLNLFQHLVFSPSFRPTYSHYWLCFATNFLKYRNSQSLISTIAIYCNSDAFSNSCYCRKFKILEYALSHNVEHLRICSVDFVPSTPLTSAFIQTLHLTSCDNATSMNWTMPNLTSLHLEYVKFGDRISGFQNLKELTIVGYFTICYAPRVFTIDCPNLETLTLAPHLRNRMFRVSAPKLLYFQFRSSYLPDFSAGDGFPCIEEADFHIQIEDDEWKFYNEKTIKRMMQKFVTMWNSVKGTPLLSLQRKQFRHLFCFQY